MRLIILSSKLLTNLFLILALSSCATYDIADIGPMIRLPASGRCYQITVLSQQKRFYDREECDEMMKRAIFIVSKDWKANRFAIQKNCQWNKCKQLQGVADELFLTLDEALMKMPF